MHPRPEGFLGAFLRPVFGARQVGVVIFCEKRQKTFVQNLSRACKIGIITY